MKKIISLIIAIAATYFVYAKEGNGNTVKASLNAVTVYRAGAEMNHQAKAQLNSGNNELIIENISNALDQNSIQVNCDGNVTVTGIEFSKDYLKEEVKRDKKELEQRNGNQ